LACKFNRQEKKSLKKKEVKKSDVNLHIIAHRTDGKRDQGEYCFATKTGFTTK